MLFSDDVIKTWNNSSLHDGTGILVRKDLRF